MPNLGETLSDTSDKRVILPDERPRRTRSSDLPNASVVTASGWLLRSIAMLCGVAEYFIVRDTAIAIKVALLIGYYSAKCSAAQRR